MSDPAASPPNVVPVPSTGPNEGVKPRLNLGASVAPQPAPEPDPKPAQKQGQKQAAKPGPKQGGKTPPKHPAIVVRPVAEPARRRARHWGLLLSFLIMVVAPIAATWWYLNERAADQYGSTLGFTVRSEDSASATDLLGGIGTALGAQGGGSSNSDILYAFIRSQEIVSNADRELDLRGIYSRHTEDDPVFGFHNGGDFYGIETPGTIEDLTQYWQRMVRISYDQTSGLMEVTALAFDPQEAQAIAQAIYDQSLERINALSNQARTDATRYASEDLALQEELLKQASDALTAFRVENQIVDLTTDIQGQMGVLGALQQELVTAQIELDLLLQNSSPGSARIEQVQIRIEAIERRIEEERLKFGTGVQGGASFATTAAEFERLTLEREFAQEAYVGARALYDSAVAEASRQSLYLAAYIEPTLAQRSEYPQHGLIIGLVALFSFLGWSILALVYYSLRDRR